MINAILTGIMKFLLIIVQSIMAPINTILVSLFPDIFSYLAKFIYVLENIIVEYAYYFLSILPENTRLLVIYYLSFLVSYYSIYGIILVVSNVFKLIRNIKFW